MLGRKIKISFFFKSAKLLGPFLTLLQSQKSTKAAALVALVVMTPLSYIKETFRQTTLVKQMSFDLNAEKTYGLNIFFFLKFKNHLCSESRNGCQEKMYYVGN